MRGVVYRRGVRANLSPKGSGWGAAGSELKATDPEPQVWAPASAKSAALGSPLAFAQSRDGAARVLRELHVALGVTWPNTTPSPDQSFQVASVLSRVVVIAGDAQALNGVAFLYPGTDLAGAINGRLVFDSWVTTQGISTFRWSPESGPLIEPDETATVLLAIAVASGVGPLPSMPKAVYSYGSVAASYQALQDPQLAQLGRAVDRE